MKTKTRSVLLKTSSNNDVQHSGETLLITGLMDGIRFNDILDFKQINQRAEVVRVARVTVVGATAPTTNTTYTISIKDPNRRSEGYTGYSRRYSFTTPPVLTTMGATAADQNEYITTRIVAAINADSSNFVSAATVTGGNGFTITDDAGYYPARLNGGSGGRKGTSSIVAVTNSDGTGYVQSQIADTTSAVYSFGNGTRMLQDMPVLHAYSGNIISGEYDAPMATDGTFAVSGQLYSAFYINSLCTQSAHAVTDQIAHALQTDIIFVDNGTGASTTNLAGFKTFRRAMHMVMFETYRSNASSFIDFFSGPIMLEGALGAAPATTGTQKMFSEERYQYTQIGTQTIVGPVISATGLLLDQDLTDTEGAEYVPSILTNDPREFVVGKTPFSVTAELVAGDCTDIGYLVGFRKKAAHAADWNDYTDLVGVGGIATVAGGTPNGDLISTNGILNNAATVTTSTGVIPADGVSYVVTILVAMNGKVTCKVNGTVYPVYSVGTTPLVFDAGDIMIPFLRAVIIGAAADPDAVISEFVAVNSDSWLA